MENEEFRKVETGGEEVGRVSGGWVAETEGGYGRDIRERTFEFARRVVELVRSYEEPRTVSSTGILLRQLLRSGTSVGANLEEANAAESRADFLHKLKIALKECRETHYWLRLLRSTSIVSENRTDDLFDECDQILRILTTIAKNTRRAPRP